MDSLTLTCVYTYAMITICADSWNSRSVLWPMIFFGTAKFPWVIKLNRINHSRTSKFFFSINRLGKNVARISSCHPTLSSSGGGVRPFAAWIAVVGRPVVVLVVIRAIAVTVVIRIALVAVRTARAVVSVPLGKIKITFQSKKGTERRKGGKGKVWGGAAHLTVSSAVFRHCWI